MRGTDAKTGKELSGIAHLEQSVRDILTTPLGSRVGRRDYGSRLFSLIDKPLNRSVVMDVYAATAEALATHEPRIRVTRVSASMPAVGQLDIDVEGEYLPDGRAITIQGVTVK